MKDMTSSSSSWRPAWGALSAAALVAVFGAACADRDATPTRPALPGGGDRGDVAPPPLDHSLRTARPGAAMAQIGGPLWRPIGPAGIRDGQTENIAPDNRVGGAVHALVPHPTDVNRMWIGTVNGGIWETRDARAANPTWRPLTDRLPSSSISALELDPTDPGARTLIAGYGNVSSYGQSHFLNGIIYSRNGGQSWREITDPLLVGRSVVGVAARGDVLLAATSSQFGTYEPGGVLRSTDRGATWAQVTGIPAGIDAFDLTVDPNDPEHLAVVTEGAVYRSVDGGTTWTNASAADAIISGLLNDPALTLAELDVGPTGRIFLIITRFGFGAYIGYTDGGAWTAMDLPYTPESGLTPIQGAVAQPFGVLITSPAHGLFTGALVDVRGIQGLTGATGVFIVVVASPDAFFLFQVQAQGTYTGGGTWQLVNGTNPKAKSNGSPSPFGAPRRPGGQGSIHLSIAADPKDRNIVYVGGDRQDLNFTGEVLNFIGAENFSGRLFRGDTRPAPTGGVLSPQWAHLTHRNDIPEVPSGGTASTSSPHADSRDLELDASGELIEADDGGVYRRTAPTSNTGDWISMVGNLQVTELHNIAYDRISRTATGGAQDVGTPMSEPGTRLWFDFTQGDGGDVSIDDVTLAAEGKSIRYTAFPGAPIAIRSTWDAAGALVDAAQPALAPLDGVQLAGSFTTPVELNAVAPTRVLIGGSNGVFESLDQGETTRLVGPGITSFTNAMAYGGERGGQPNPDILYYGSRGVVFRRAEAGAVAAPTAAPFPGAEVRDIALAPRDHDTAIVLDRDRVYATADGGATWVNLTGNLVDASLRSVVVIQPIPQLRIVIVGGLAGVSIAVLAGPLGPPPTWLTLGSNLPTVPVWDLDWDPEARVLTVGTLGRGAFQTRL
jgi:hypothetical protein